MKYHTFFFRKLGKMLEKLSSTAVVIGALRAKRGADHEKNCIFVVQEQQWCNLLSTSMQSDLCQRD